MTVRPLSAVQALAHLLPTYERAGDGADTPGMPDESRSGTNGAEVGRLARQVGMKANDCVAAAMVGDQTELVKASAAFLDALLSIWVAEGVDPGTVWNELHARTEMGELLLTLSRAPARQRTRRSAPWRVATSKLP